MEIKPIHITVRQLFEGYEYDEANNHIVGYGGKLDIRPIYQRELVYKGKQLEAVIDTVMKGFPLNVMYWAVREDETFEIIDGQQRTLSICMFVNGDFSIGKGTYFHSLKNDVKEKLLDYELHVYVCKGTDSEKLSWFETINIAGVVLSPQELRNATYAGSWLTDAKRYFSKTNCAAAGLSKNYVYADVDRQELLQTAISWISKGEIVEYMSKHQFDANAGELWEHFQKVIEWIKKTFIVTRKSEMKSVKWGRLYDAYKDAELDPNKLEERIKKYMSDSDIGCKSGIYPYVLDGKESHLSIRAFDDNMKRSVYEKQNGICKICGKHFDIEKMEADHITPWSEGGRTIEENCQMLCRECNRRKSNK